MQKLWDWLLSAMGEWHQAKLFFERSLSVEHDALHVIVGFLVWLLIAVISRRPLSSWRPFWWLFALILWNEAVDLWVELWPDAGKQLGEGAKDLTLTILLPALMTALIRARPKLFVVGKRK